MSDTYFRGNFAEYYNSTSFCTPKVLIGKLHDNREAWKGYKPYFYHSVSRETSRESVFLMLHLLELGMLCPAHLPANQNLKCENRITEKANKHYSPSKTPNPK